MERLNDILGYSAQRRQRPAEQRPNPQGAQQPPRQSQGGPNGARRTMHEQTGRLGQQPYANRRLQPSGPTTRPPREQTDTPVPGDYEARNYGARNPRRQYNPETPMSNSVAPHQETARYPQ